MMLGTYEKFVAEALCRRYDLAIIFWIYGAFSGYYTLMCAKLMKGKDRIIAFEPNPIVYRYLRLNLIINNLHNVTAINVAVSDFNGLGKLVIPKNLMNQGWLVTRITEGYVVPVAKLGSFLSRIDCHPDVIKIDVEGEEMKVIEGALRTLSNGIRTLIVELHNKDEKDNIVGLYTRWDIETRF